MPVRWDAERDQKLLLLIIHNVKIDKEQIALAWGEKYGKQDAPTPRAIVEHIASLKGKIDKGVTSLPKSANTTPAKPSTPRTTTASYLSKTPKSSAKRSHEKLVDDMYDSEPDMDDVELTPRTPLSRRSKSAAKRLKVESDADSVQSLSDYMIAEGHDNARKPAGKVSTFSAISDDSDVSEFVPGQGSK